MKKYLINTKYLIESCSCVRLSFGRDLQYRLNSFILSSNLTGCILSNAILIALVLTVCRAKKRRQFPSCSVEYSPQSEMNGDNKNTQVNVQLIKQKLFEN